LFGGCFVELSTRTRVPLGSSDDESPDPRRRAVACGREAAFKAGGRIDELERRLREPEHRPVMHDVGVWTSARRAR
jgi:hypothetical protein